MNKVTSVNLGGNAYQMEGAGYERIKAYLDASLAKLAGNPDAAEIQSDLERAIGEKAKRFLSPHKNVISTEEIDTILAEMGPVHATTEEARTEETPSPSTETPKKLYRIREGAMISGVCNGLAAYWNVDVSLVRLGFVVLGILSHGAMLLAYVVMVVVIPAAGSPEAYARASGAPFTAQEFIDRAKAEYHDFRHKQAWDDWKHKAKAERKALKREWRRVHHEREHRHSKNPLWALLHTLIGLAWCVAIVFFAVFAYRHSFAFHHFVDLCVVFGHRVVDAARVTFSQ